MMMMLEGTGGGGQGVGYVLPLQGTKKEWVGGVEGEWA